jgi:hypothetical protein
MNEEFYVDSMSLAVLKDNETNEDVDYVFIADVWGKDPRRVQRQMIVGQNRGLFRLHKTSMQVELLRAMAGDVGNKRFHNAAAKVLREFQSTGIFPDVTQFASG